MTADISGNISVDIFVSMIIDTFVTIHGAADMYLSGLNWGQCCRSQKMYL